MRRKIKSYFARFVESVFINNAMEQMKFLKEIGTVFLAQSWVKTGLEI